MTEIAIVMTPYITDTNGDVNFAEGFRKLYVKYMGVVLYTNQKYSDKNAYSTQLVLNSFLGFHSSNKTRQRTKRGTAYLACH